MSNAVIAQGVKFLRGDGAEPEVFVAISEVLSISGPNESAKQIDVTSMDSTSREYKAGLKDGGEIQIEYNYDPDSTSQRLLRTDFAGRAISNFKIELPDSDAAHATPTSFAFAAMVVALGPKFGVDAQITGSCTLKITGDVTETPRAAA